MMNPVSALRRLWQPRKPLFWLVVVLNLMSSAMTSALVVVQPTGAMRGLLSLFALLNTLAGWWLLTRLWRETAADDTKSHPS
jgi:4-hydroxybenzoate polyprenyltransferase